MRRLYIIFLVKLLMFVFTISCCPKNEKINVNRLNERMMFGDVSRNGVPFSKDPHVIKLEGKYYLYYSIPAYSDKSNPVKGWGIGIAKSTDMIHWDKIGEITPREEYEKKGICAPCVLVIDNKIHIFYQTYGNRKNDAICHAVSENGIDFKRNNTNPVFRPSGGWNCGRAIDAEVIKFNDRYFLYYATRDKDMKIQMLGVASAPANTNFNRNDWKEASDSSILAPVYPWEGKCIEGASVIQRDSVLYMFYAGAYNNKPQQIGAAKSSDGIKWTRLSNKPFLQNGDPGEWNSSESGHPHIFKDGDGRTYLFFQGNDDHGKTWYISKAEVKWNDIGPYLVEKQN